MIMSRTPFRMSFFGGGTDFPEYYRTGQGSVLCTTIDKYAYLSIHRLTPFFRHRFRASYAKTESVQTPGEFQHPLIRECLLHLDIQEGMEISHVADLPGQTGLGTSSSFTVGLLNALHAFRNDTVTAAQLAEEAIIIERERVGDAGGHQDQYAAAFGGFLRLDFGPDGVAVQRLQIEAHRLRALEGNLLCFYLGQEASANDILNEQAARTQQNRTALNALRRLVDEAQHVIEQDSIPLSVWGDLMDTAWQIKRELAPGISNNRVDEAYQAARQAGARGGKLLGAGGRGFLCLYVEPEHQASVRSALPDLQEVPFSFSSAGSQIIFKSGHDG